MDYKRIYGEFIKDRRGREPSLTGYVERHHIEPRSLGGADDQENLIRLTPEDHFFAHLLLAKIYGGTLWAPIAFMVGGTRKDYKPVVSRERYGWAARAMARARSGRNAHQFDSKVYRLEHRDGATWRGTQMDMYERLGMSRPLANLLAKGRIKSALGWFFEGKPPQELSGANHPMYRAEVWTFVHVDGRRFVGTQHDLHKVHGVPKSNACLLVKGQYRCAKGWYVEGRPPTAKSGRGAKYRRQLAV